MWCNSSGKLQVKGVTCGRFHLRPGCPILLSTGLVKGTVIPKRLLGGGCHIKQDFLLIVIAIHQNCGKLMIGDFHRILQTVLQNLVSRCIQRIGDQ